MSGSELRDRTEAKQAEALRDLLTAGDAVVLAWAQEGPSDGRLADEIPKLYSALASYRESQHG